jgi:hypothetical protein
MHNAFNEYLHILVRSAKNFYPGKITAHVVCLVLVKPGYLSRDKERAVAVVVQG